MSGNSGGRATVQIPEDVIISSPANNNSTSETDIGPATVEPAPAQNALPPTPPVVIGEPAAGYNIHQSIIMSHHYFEKIIHSDGSTRGKCLVCWMEKKKEVLYKMPDGNLRSKELSL